MAEGCHCRCIVRSTSRLMRWRDGRSTQTIFLDERERERQPPDLQELVRAHGGLTGSPPKLGPPTIVSSRNGACVPRPAISGGRPIAITDIAKTAPA